MRQDTFNAYTKSLSKVYELKAKLFMLVNLCLKCICFIKQK